MPDRARQPAEVLAGDGGKFFALALVDGGLGGLDRARGAGLDLDEAEHVAIPADQVDLAVTPGRAPVARHHQVTLAAQVKICLFLAAASGFEVRGLRRGTPRQPVYGIQSSDQPTSEAS